MKAKIHFWQELQPDGSVADSWIRALSCLSFILLVIYLYYAKGIYITIFNTYTDLLISKVITEQTYFSLNNQLKQVDDIIFFTLVALTAAPKVVQKAIEAWSSSKFTSTNTTSTITSKETTQIN